MYTETRRLLLNSLAIACLLGSRAAAQDVVTVDNPPVWGENVSLVETLRIGAADGALEYLFGSILAIRPLSDGSIVVADRQGPVVRKFSAGGEYLHGIGASGSGPGELNNLMGMRTLPDDEIVIWDVRNRRLNFFDADGGFLESHPVDSGLSSSDVLHVSDDGRSWIKDMLVEEGKNEHGEFPMVFIEITRDGELHDPVTVPPVSDDDGFVLFMEEGGRRPFYRETLHTFARTGEFVVGDNDEYSLEFREGGKVARRLLRPFEPVDVRDEERKQWADIAVWFEQTFSADNPSYPTVPRSKPAFRKLNVDSDGRIWVERYVVAEHRPQEEGGNRPPLEWREPSVYDVMEPDGTLLGQVRLPFGAYFHDARGMSVYAEFSGDEDVPYVVRYRIETE